MREEGFEDVRGISELLPSLMEELETTWRRIGVELERLGISTGILSEPIQPSACPGLSSLSRREWEVLNLFVAGSRVPNIARTLCISPHTVRNHLQSVYRKLEVGSQAELIEKIKGPARTSLARSQPISNSASRSPRLARPGEPAAAARASERVGTISGVKLAPVS